MQCFHLNSLKRIFVSIFFASTLWFGCELHAQDQSPANSEIAELFPSATRVGEPDTELGIIPIYQLNQLIGYVFESNNLTNFPGFSGETINLRIALDTKGIIRGIKIISHHEPIFLYGLGQKPLHEFVQQYLNRRIDQRLLVGKSSSDKDENTNYIDGITKATVSVMVIHDTILGAAMRVARMKLSGFEAPPEVAFKSGFTPMSVNELISKDYLKSWHVLEAVGIENVQLDSLRENNAESLIDIHWAFINSERVGRNLLGDDEYKRLFQELAPGELALMMSSNGAISFIEPEFASGSTPNRLSIYQNGYAVDIRDLNFYSFYPESFTENFPTYRDINIFRIKANSGFDLSSPFELRMTLFISSNPIQTTSITLSKQVSISPALIEKNEMPQATPTPLWQRLWQQRAIDIAVLTVYLCFLTGLFVFQRQLAPRYGKWLPNIRLISLFFIIGFIGYYAQGQLSVVNIYTLLLSVWQGFDVHVFLLDPILFIIWSFVFISLFLWGRGLFCGWLCPFGAFQELIGRLANWLRLPQWKPLDSHHRTLQRIKYPILIGLIMAAFFDLSMAETLAEIEPFKTTLTMNFFRHWPFVTYAFVLLGAGLFVHKFYCRYLCPLGAGLAILGRLRLFSWLKRRKECGNPCQLCHKKCEINAIRFDGRIDYNECIQCLECLVIINDQNRCVIGRYGNKKNRRNKRSAALLNKH